MYSNFLEEIDAIDNGIEVAEGILRYRITSTLSHRVGWLNPAWNEEGVEEDVSRGEGRGGKEEGRGGEGGGRGGEGRGGEERRGERREERGGEVKTVNGFGGREGRMERMGWEGKGSEWRRKVMKNGRGNNCCYECVALLDVEATCHSAVCVPFEIRRSVC